jgi:hypothetical protein
MRGLPQSVLKRAPTGFLESKEHVRLLAELLNQDEEHIEKVLTNALVDEVHGL